MKYQHDCMLQEGLKLANLMGVFVPAIAEVDTMVGDMPAWALIQYFKGCELLHNLHLENQVRLVQCWSLGPHVDQLRNKEHVLIMLQGGGTLYSIKEDLSIEELVMRAGTGVILPNYLPHSFIADHRRINRFAMIQIIDQPPQQSCGDLTHEP